MFRPFRRKSTLVFSFFLLLASQTFALPNPHQGLHITREEFIRRQDGSFNGPQTVQSVTNTPTPFGVITETCTTTLTPIVDQAGNPQVLAVKECTVVVSGNNRGQSGTQTTSLSTTTAQTSASSTDTTSPTTLILTSTTFSSPTDSTTAQTTQTPPPVLTTTSDAASTTLVTSSAGSGNTEISVIGTTTVPNTAVTSSASATTSSSVVATTSSAAETTSIPPNDSSAIGGITSTSIPTTSVGGVAGTDVPAGTSTNPSGTQAAENNTTSSAAAEFQLPGKQLQVLPIGLGVFAGISVIALIVVALVTYERTKYRKAFRQRKLAESGAAMGYGGMLSR